MNMSSQNTSEINAGNRFAFGENWSRFLLVLDDDRIRRAEQSLCDMLNVKDLQGKGFLDIGSGSGLFSLAARRLGATVHSFDYDPQSVACTNELKQRYFPDDTVWKVDQGSVLDRTYLESLGQAVFHLKWQRLSKYSISFEIAVSGSSGSRLVPVDMAATSSCSRKSNRSLHLSCVATPVVHVSPCAG